MGGLGRIAMWVAVGAAIGLLAGFSLWWG